MSLSQLFVKSRPTQRENFEKFRQNFWKTLEVKIAEKPVEAMAFKALGLTQL